MKEDNYQDYLLYSWSPLWVLHHALFPVKFTLHLQSLMNHIFQPFIYNFVSLVLFDDILIYSKPLHGLLSHVDQVLDLLSQHQLFLKRSKCAFGAFEVEYLDHILGKDGVWVDPKKIETMKDSPFTNTLKSLWGFHGLTGYYRKFVHNYGKIAALLVALLKKKYFSWNAATNQSFQALKEVVCTIPVLALLDFTKTIFLECDGLVLGCYIICSQIQGEVDQQKDNR